MTKATVEAVEAEMPVRFRGPDRLREHVEKHLLQGMRDEKWRKLIDNSWLLEAADEYRHKGYGDACRELGNAYETLLGAKLAMLCRERRGHAHLVALDQTIDIALLANHAPADRDGVQGQCIEAWDSDSNLFISANCFVRNRGWTEYCLTTGYRAHPELGKAAFTRKIRENFTEKRRVNARMQQVLAEHFSNESDT